MITHLYEPDFFEINVRPKFILGDYYGACFVYNTEVQVTSFSNTQRYGSEYDKNYRINKRLAKFMNESEQVPRKAIARYIPLLGWNAHLSDANHFKMLMIKKASKNLQEGDHIEGVESDGWFIIK